MGQDIDLSWLWEHFTIYAIDTGKTKNTKNAVAQVKEHPERDLLIEQLGETTRKIISVVQ